uniref:Ycf13 n=1 Tax=Lepocinclis ovum TaxID=86638 RepID=A0A3G3LLY9_9EUGL|nr:ycf13 [Lepocinclis ovum]AYQ93729.1 ycf13 [Lepocinclis ovum]
MFIDSHFFIPWEKARINVFRLQRRIFKSVYTGDILYAFRLQKLLLVSNSARLLVVRFVTQDSSMKKVSRSENKISLNLFEKFKLSSLLLENAHNWIPSKGKVIFLSDDNLFSTFHFKLWSLSDRCWQCLVKLVIEPAHFATFSPRNFSFNYFSITNQIYNVISLNLCRESYGLQKRILLIKFSQQVTKFSSIVLLKKILVPRSIKLGIFRFLRLGLYLHLNLDYILISFFEFFLANILLGDVDFIGNTIRAGSNILVFLKPNENEVYFFNKLNKLLYSVGIDSNEFVTFQSFSVRSGFDFLDWHFQLYSNGKVSCIPSTQSYRSFLMRVKRIINNSNFGTKAKVLKVSPIIKEWKYYNNFCDASSLRLSLFFLRKKVFNTFVKESSQDLYSSKDLLDRSFLLSEKSTSKSSLKSFPYNFHLFFCSTLNGELFRFTFPFCVHCGMNVNPSIIPF